MRSAKNPSVLVVDDVEDIRDLLKLALTFEGYEVAVAADGPEALHHVATDPPELIILDLTMPGMSGFEVLRALQGDPVTAAIPVVIISGRSDHAAAERSLAAGAAAVTVKPFDIESFVATVGATLRASDAEAPISVG